MPHNSINRELKPIQFSILHITVIRCSLRTIQLPHGVVRKVYELKQKNDFEYVFVFMLCLYFKKFFQQKSTYNL